MQSLLISDLDQQSAAPQKKQEARIIAATRDLKKAISYGVIFGLLVAPVAAAYMVGFDSVLIYFLYTLHWALGFSIFGAWFGAMFLSGEFCAVCFIEPVNPLKFVTQE